MATSETAHVSPAHVAAAPFDVNLLDESLSLPTVALDFPFPVDEPAARLSVLGSFLEQVSGYKFSDVYLHNERHPSSAKPYKPYHANHQGEHFVGAMREHMTNTLYSDPKLDEVVDKVVHAEVHAGLVRASATATRRTQVRNYMVDYYTHHNRRNFTLFESLPLLRLAYWIMIPILRNIFPEGIWCRKLEYEQLHAQLAANPMLVVYCPLHKLHVDYIIMHVVSIRMQLSLPLVIAGDNLNLAVFGPMLKNMGATFIKRSFAGDLYTADNLSNYIDFLLTNRINLEVFIEGTRLRNGKLMLPKFGVLKNIVHSVRRAHEAGAATDVLVQPVAIQYEQLYEHFGYLNELMGNDKKLELFARVVYTGVTNMLPLRGTKLGSGRGRIYVLLGDNFCLQRDFLLALPQELPSQQIIQLGFKILNNVNAALFVLESMMALTAVYVYYYSLYDRLNHPDEVRGRSTAPQTASGIKYRNKVTYLDTLAVADTFRWLVRYVTLRQLLPAKAPVMAHLRAMVQLRSREELASLVDASVKQFLKEVTVVLPLQTTECLARRQLLVSLLIELMYYKNLVVHLVAEDSIAALILVLLSNHNYNNNKIITLRKLVRIDRFLRQVFKLEFLFARPLADVLALFQHAGYITMTEEDRLQGQAIFRINDMALLVRLLVFMKPFVELFRVCLHNISEILLDGNVSEEITTKELLRVIQLKKPHYDVKYHEAINKMNLLNVIWFLDLFKIAHMYTRPRVVLTHKVTSEQFIKITNPEVFVGFMNLIDFVYYYDGNYSIGARLHFTYAEYEFKQELIDMEGYMLLHGHTKL